MSRKYNPLFFCEKIGEKAYTRPKGKLNFSFSFYVILKKLSKMLYLNNFLNKKINFSV
tara:strand:- start:350 stop:523 length:174 start_codon:yes stop_codon:yes gene_type:complete